MTNAGATNENASDKDEFPSHSTPEDLEAMFDNFIQQVKAGAVEGIELDDCYTPELTIQQMDHGDWRRRLMVHASAETGKYFWLTNVTRWLLHEVMSHINRED